MRGSVCHMDGARKKVGLSLQWTWSDFKAWAGVVDMGVPWAVPQGALFVAGARKQHQRTLRVHLQWVLGARGPKRFCPCCNSPRRQLVVTSEGMVEGWTEGVLLKHAKGFGTWIGRDGAPGAGSACAWMDLGMHKSVEQLGFAASIVKNPDGAWGSGAHASTARHMAFCVQHRWSTDAEVGYKWPCPQRRCWRVEQKVHFGAWPSVVNMDWGMSVIEGWPMCGLRVVISGTYPWTPQSRTGGRLQGLLP